MMQENWPRRGSRVEHSIQKKIRVGRKKDWMLYWVNLNSMINVNIRIHPCWGNDWTKDGNGGKFHCILNWFFLLLYFILKNIIHISLVFLFYRGEGNIQTKSIQTNIPTCRASIYFSVCQGSPETGGGFGWFPQTSQSKTVCLILF